MTLAALISTQLVLQLIGITYVLVIVFTIGYIIYEKRDPVNTLAWSLTIALIPILGLVVYILFGRNHRKDKLFDRKEIFDLGEIREISEIQLSRITDPNYNSNEAIENNRDFITLMLRNSKALLTKRNRVEILNNGEPTFKSMLEAMESAKSFIHMEYYIYEDDETGELFAEVMKRKAREGVEVRFIYDDVGSWGLSRKFIRGLQEAGVEIGCFMPVAFPWFTSKLNYRNHRKIMIVDGKVGYTGGINIASRYMGLGKEGYWRDTHLKLEGDSVAVLHAVFAGDWFFVTESKIVSAANLEKYVPHHDIKEQIAVQVVASGPDSDWSSIMQAFFYGITHAKHHIYISTPYFLPNQAILLGLKVAALSGIDVRLMIPHKSDSKIVYWATRSYVEEMLEAGVKVYFYMKGFNHSKIIMIDGELSTVGTANMDMRSFDHNFEVNAFMYDAKITEELEGYFLEDLEHSEVLNLEQWKERRFLHSLYESLARLFSPLL